MKFFVWTGADMENDNYKKQVTKKEAIEKFGADFVRLAADSFKKSSARDKAIIGITYNSLGSCWDEDYIYNLTIER